MKGDLLSNHLEKKFLIISSRVSVSIHDTQKEQGMNQFSGDDDGIMTGQTHLEFPYGSSLYVETCCLCCKLLLSCFSFKRVEGLIELSRIIFSHDIQSLSAPCGSIALLAVKPFNRNSDMSRIAMKARWAQRMLQIHISCSSNMISIKCVCLGHSAGLWNPTNQKCLTLHQNLTSYHS